VGTTNEEEILQQDLMMLWAHGGAWAVPLTIFLAALLAGLMARSMVLRWLKRWTVGTRTSLDDIVMESIRHPLLLWVLILALELATEFSQLPARQAGIVAKVLLVLWITSLTLVAAQLVGQVVRLYGPRVQEGMQVTSLTENIARAAVIVMGALILLNQFGLSIAPILTALGVGGLAVALALQDTLANFFAGFYIMVAGQIRVGDYVKLNSGEEGYVADISWRSLSIRALTNNIIVIPNLKVAQANVTNYWLPEKRMALLIPVGVSYDNDPDEIERVLLEEANLAAASGEVDGLLADPPPLVRFIPGFGDSSLNFTLIVQVREFVDQFLVQHELRKRILRRFRKDGIEIPFPMRTVHIRSGGASGSQAL
jgi:small-conductance mechanosensitive channel